MLTEERQNEIVKIVNISGSISVQDLVYFLDISESTVRRDLFLLSQQGRLRRVHGGATAIKENMYEDEPENFPDEYSFHALDKRRIAEFAAEKVKKDDFVYLDASSTVERMAEFLIGSEATFVTNSIPLAQKLGRNDVKVHILPGLVKGKSEAIIGSEMRDTLERYHFTLGFFGTYGIDWRTGCTISDDEEAVCKRAAVERCMEACVLADCSKFGVSAHITFADIKQITLITAKGSDIVDYTPYRRLTEVHVL